MSKYLKLYIYIYIYHFCITHSKIFLYHFLLRWYIQSFHYFWLLLILQFLIVGDMIHHSNFPSFYFEFFHTFLRMETSEKNNVYYWNIYLRYWVLILFLLRKVLIKLILTSSVCRIALSWSIPSLVFGFVRKSINSLSSSELWCPLSVVCSLLFWFSNDVAGKSVALRLMKYRKSMTRQNIHQNVVRNRVEMDWNGLKNFII